MALTLLLGLELRDSAASTATDRLFQSVLPSPTAVHTAPRTPTRTATVIGGRTATPTRTPTRTATSRALAPLLGAAKRHLPLALKGWPPTPTFTLTATPTRTPTPPPTPIQYGWKGIAGGETLGATAANGFLGINPDWWYNWGYNGPFVVRAASATTYDAISAALASSSTYVPMVWCPNDVSPSDLTPQQAGNLAAQYPGRVWLLFNEPDVVTDPSGGQCGALIFAQYNSYYPHDADNNVLNQQREGWSPLGDYLARQYILYYDAIKLKDPTARVFSMAMNNLPLPDSMNPWWKDGLPVWDAFISGLATRQPPVPTPTRILDGIAIHAYPGNASTYHASPVYCDGRPSPPAPCPARNPFVDYGCVERALPAAHAYFQSKTATHGKPIWITEIGSLNGVNRSESYACKQSWPDTRDKFQLEILRWLAAQMPEGGQTPYINAAAWYSTNAYDPAHDKDHSASNLLNHLAPGQLTEVGRAWATATPCPHCTCPGYDCR